MIAERIRLFNNPQTSSPPPAGTVDLLFNPSLNLLVQFNPDGTMTQIGSVATSVGGYGAADANKVPKFGTSGNLKASDSVEVKSLLGGTSVKLQSDESNPGGALIASSGFTVRLPEPQEVGGSPQMAQIPPKSGMVAVIPLAVDDAAAVAAGLTVGDVYYKPSTDPEVEFGTVRAVQPA